MHEVGFSSCLSHTSWMLSPEQSAKHMADAETCLSNDSPFLVISEKGEVNDSQLPSGEGQWLSTLFSSVAQSCPTLCDPMDCGTPVLPVHRQLPEFTQTHVHWVGNIIQPSHPMSSPSAPTFNHFHHQCLPVSQFFATSGQSIGVSASASVLPMNIQGWFPLGWTDWISLLSTMLTFNKNNTLKDNFSL